MALLFSLIARVRGAVAASSAPKPLFLEEQVEAVVALLKIVGLLDERSFRAHMQQEEAYFSKYFEYTERGEGMRFLVRHPSLGARVTVVRHGAREAWYSDELLEETNRKLAELFTPAS